MQRSSSWSLMFLWFLCMLRSLLESTHSTVVFCHNDCQEGKTCQHRPSWSCSCLVFVDLRKLIFAFLVIFQETSCCWRADRAQTNRSWCSLTLSTAATTTGNLAASRVGWLLFLYLFMIKYQYMCRCSDAAFCHTHYLNFGRLVTKNGTQMCCLLKLFPK